MAATPPRDPGFLSGKSAPISFKDVVSGSTSSSFPELTFSSHRGLPALLIAEDEVRSLAKPFEFSLVGRFPGRRPSVDAIRKFCFNLKLIGNFSVTVLNNRNVLIKLENDFDYCRIFSHRSYFVQNCFMKVVKWTHHLDVEVDSPIVPIWISFPLLRPHFFSPRILFGLGSLFGRPLKSDLATASGSRPSMARILVELDVTKKHAEKVWVGSVESGYVQTVIFDEIPSFCTHCLSLGHSKEACSILHPNRIVSKTGIAQCDLPVLKEHVAEGAPNETVLIESNERETVEPVVVSSQCDLPVLKELVAEGAPNGIVLIQSNERETDEPIADSGRLLDLNPTADVLLEKNREDNVLGVKVVSVEADASLSPNALPFFPSSVGLIQLDGNEGIEINNLVSDSSEGLISNGVMQESGPTVGDGSELRVSPDSQNLVNVHVKLVESNVALGSNSEMVVGSHGDWLNNSSEENSDSDSFSDPDFEFSMVSGKPLKVTQRGKFWNRGGKRR
ncbi:hypothetical protein KFK09_024798 [Dendrobium nobile]|uniref:DUF4283 domain-containing protein n=1 Tax=Dendrobium nobile TaxID=94219 RepID=A0A8T3ADK9_DENNO|nr:hypothetical protein KFK09_024798 [Dendrobium nobile]